MADYTDQMYLVRISEELRAKCPEEALSSFLERLKNEETEAVVEQVCTGIKFFVECQTGEVCHVVHPQD